MLRLGRVKNLLNSRVITGALTTALMVLGVAWYVSEGGYEPLIAAVAGVLAFFSLFKYSFLSFDKNLTADRLALVVGNSDYQFGGGHLRGARKDVEAICRSLKANGFRIIRRENPTTVELRKAVYDFQVLLSTGGVGLFYYAGHAGQIDGKDLILPVDAVGIRSIVSVYRSSRSRSC